MTIFKFIKRSFTAALFLFSFSDAYSGDQSHLTIYVDNSYPPYMYEVENEKADGLYPRLLKEVTKKAGVSVEIKAYPWKRALSYGEAGKGAVGGAYRNDERVKIYDYSLPLYQEKMVIFVNKENSFEFNGIDDLKGKIVGVNRGWSYGQEFDAAREKEVFSVNVRNSPYENFQMLALGRIDCLILDQQSGESYINLMKIQDRVMALPQSFSENNGYLIISKQLKQTAFLEAFNASLEQIHDDGTYDKIVQEFVKGTLIQ